MKKGFTMIELIFVIVILGILASVAVPRLASTREDAEISATVANLRTLVSDASSYYVANGTFKPKGKDANWRDITNVPLRTQGKTLVQGDTNTGTAVYLSASGINCLVIRLKDRTGALPAYIEIGKVRANKKKGTCKEVVEAEPIEAYLGLKVPGITPIEKNDNKEPEAGVIALGSSISIHQ